MTEKVIMSGGMENRVRVFGVVLGLSTAVCGVTMPAAAQDDTKAAATAAFDQAKQLKLAGKLADACLKFGESERLDPQLGTLLHLADCLAQNGQTASAWAAFREAQELAEKRKDPRQGLAEARLAKLTPRLSNLQINVPKGMDPSTLHVERDHVAVGSALWGGPVPTDPGAHTITVSAPGHHSWTGTTVVPAESATSVVNVPELELDVPIPAQASTTVPRVAPRSASSSPSTDSGTPASGSTQTVLGITAIGAGVAGLVIGALFEVQRSSKLSSRNAICPSGVDCPVGTQARIDDLTNRARSASTVGTIGFIAGGILVATGTALVLTAPHRSGLEVQLSPVLSRQFMGLALNGDFL